MKLTLGIKEFIVFEIYFLLYVLLVPFILIFDRNVIWKGRKY